MKIIVGEDTLKLVAGKDRDEILLGCFLLLAGIVLLYAVPVVFYQEWSYRFGHVAKKWRVCLSVFMTLTSIFFMAGAFYNLFYRPVYIFDLTGRILTIDTVLFRSKQKPTFKFDEFTGVIHKTAVIAPGKERHWIGMRFRSGQPLYFSEYFDNRKESGKIVETISEVTLISTLGQADIVAKESS